MVGRCYGSELCSSSSQSTSLGSKLDLGCMGGCYSLETENSETEKLLKQEARQGKGKRERTVQRKGQACCGCQHTAIALSLHSSQLGHAHPTNTVSCNSVDAAHCSNARRSCGTGCGSHCSDQACLPRFCSHAKRSPRSIGSFRTGSEQAGDSRPAPCDCQSRPCPESSPRAGGIQREAPPALVPTSSGVAENVERPNGWLRYSTRTVSSSHPKSQSGYGSGPSQHTDPQRKSCWETSTRPHCGGQDRRSWSTGRSGPGGTCYAEDIAQFGGSVRPQGMWQSDNTSGQGARARDYHGGIRGRNSGWSKAASLYLAIWWSNQTHPGFDNYHWFECPGTSRAETYGETRHARWEVTSGSAPTCLRNAERLPSKRRGPVRFTGVEAYPSVCDRLGAACPAVRFFEDLFSQVDDNFTMNAPFDDFLFPYEAQRQAALHHWTCSLTDLFDSISPDVQSSYLRNSELMTIALHDTLVDLSAPQADEDSDVRTCPLDHAQKDAQHATSSPSRSPFHCDPLPHVFDRWCAIDCPVFDDDPFDAPDDDIQETRKPKHAEWSFPPSIRRTLTDGLFQCLSADEATAITKFVTENSHLTTVTIRTYGFQDFSRGQRDLRIPIHRLIHWKDFAADTWKDVMRPDDLLTIIVTPQPDDQGIDLHAIVTSTSHLLDKLVLLQIHPEEAAPVRTVVECTETSTGYTLLRRAGHDIDMEADYRFRFDDKIYYGFEILPAKRGHYWTVQISSSAAALYMQQLSAKRIHPMTWRTWPTVNEDLARILRENEEERLLAGDQTVVGPTTFDDHEEWIRIAQETENGMNTPVTLTVFGLKDVDIGTRRITIASINYRSIEDAILGLWPQFDVLAKKIHLVYPKPLENDISHVDVILEFYDLWNPLDDYWKPILQECLQPELDTIVHTAHYCPGHVSKENFPLDRTGCPGATEDIDMQVWVRGWPLPHPRNMGVVPGDLIQIRHSDRIIQVEDWIQRLFPQANIFKRNMLDQTANIARRDTTWTFLGQVRPGEPAQVDVLYPQWLRYHDPYFVVQALLEILTYRGLSFHDKVIYPTLNRNATNVTFLFGTPQEGQSLVQVTYSAKWNETWSEQFCYMTRSAQTTHDFLRSVNSLGLDAEIIHNGRLHEQDQIHLTNGDVLEIELQGESDDEDSSAGDSSSLMQRPKPSTAPGLTKTHIAGLHLPLAEIAVDTEIPLLENVAEFWPYPHVPSSSVIALHPVSDPPNFAHAEPLPMFVVQRNDDRFDQEMESDVLAVVTVSVQAPHAGQPRSQRFKILWVPYKGTRSNFIDFFRMTGHCRKADVLCFLYLNNIIWPESDMALRKIEFGDHLRLQVRTEGNSWCDFEYSEGVSRSRRLFASSSPERAPDERDDQEDEQEEEEEAARSPPSDHTIRSDRRVRQRRSRSRARRRNEGQENDSPTLLQQSLELNAKLREKMSSVGLPNEGKSHVSDLWCTQPHGDLTDLGNFSFPRVPLDDITNVPSYRAASCADPPGESQDPCRQPLHDFPTLAALPANHQSDEDHDPNNGKPRALNLDTLIPSPCWERVDCTQVRILRQQLHDFAVGPCDPSPAKIVKWHEATQQALLHTPMWIDEPAISYDFYTDGSSYKTIDDQGETSRKGAAAVVLIVTTPIGPRYGGSMAYKIPDQPTAPQTEIGALTVALLWILQLAKQHPYQSHPFQATIGYDCMTAGQVTAGHWQILANQHSQKTNRGLMQWLQQILGPDAIRCHHIKSHQGHEWNEAADAIAWAAVNDWIEASDFNSIIDLFAPGNEDAHLPSWLWFYEASQQGSTQIPSNDNCNFLVNIAAPLNDRASSEAQPLMQRQQRDAQGGPRQVYPFTLRCATANVLTLYGKENAYGSFISARQESLLQQMHHQHVHVAGIQETRSAAAGHYFTEDYHVLSSAASAKGVGGVQLWIARKWSLPSLDVAIKPKHLRIVSSTTQRLTAILNTPGLKLVLISAHAPPCEDSMVLQKFWNSISASIPKKYQNWSTIYMVDANARVGSLTTESVGDYGQEEENGAGAEFHEWLMRESCILPQTHSQHHRGPHATWVHPRGTQARLDYIAIDRHLCHPDLRTWVSDDIDLSLQRIDHMCVIMDLPLEFLHCQATKDYQRHRTPVTFKDDQADISWSTNVHDHAAMLQQWMQSTQDESHRQYRRKAHLSEHTWMMVGWKRFHWKRIRQIRWTWRNAVLRTIFEAWAHRKSSHSTTSWLRLCDTSIAWHQAQFTRFAQLAQKQVRDDDRNYYQSLAEQTTQANADEGIKGLWRSIKGILPKQRKKASSNIRCRGPDPDEIRDHFNSLEAGEHTSYAKLLAQCQQRQLAAQAEAPLVIPLAQLPTRTDFEQQILKQNINKAPGVDYVRSDTLRQALHLRPQTMYALLFKTWVTGAEPLQYKGGIIHCISKKAGGHSAKDMRGIMLLDTLGKSYHGLVRSLFMRWSEPRRLPAQYGGYKKQQTLFATQLLRSIARTAQAKSISTTILFLDVRSAFHSMVREQTFGGTTRLPERLRQLLQEEQLDVDSIEKSITSYAHDFNNTAPISLQRVLQDAHQSTWFTLANHDCAYQTHRGSRPGSPLADLAYNTMMQAVLTEVQIVMDKHNTHRQGCAKLGIQCEPVAWVDDVAIPILAVNANQLDSATSDILCQVDQIFQAHGLRLNFSQGKTEAVIQYRGEQAPALRQERFIACLGYLPLSPEKSLRTVSEYQYLGTSFSQVVYGTAKKGHDSISNVAALHLCQQTIAGEDTVDTPWFARHVHFTTWSR